MPRPSNGLKDDAFENHAQKNDAKKRCPEHGVPETVLWKRCAEKNIPETTPRRRCSLRDDWETMLTRRCGETALQPQRNRIT